MREIWSRRVLPDAGAVLIAIPSGIDIEVATDLTDEPEVDLAMARHDGRRAGRPAPPRVIGSFAYPPGVAFEQMTLEVAELHRSIVSTSGS